MENDRIADRLDEIADLLELGDGDAFRVRAYRGAARTVREHPRRLADAVAEGEDLRRIDGIGDSIAKELSEIVDRGSCERLDELRETAPVDLPELMRIRGLGARTAQQLHRELGVATMEALRQACLEHRVRALRGFGAQTEANFLEGIREQETDAGRLPLKAASEYVESIERHLRGLDELDRWVVAGSYRRRKATVGDLDVIVQAPDRAAAVKAIAAWEGFEKTVSQGREKATLQLHGGLRVDFRFFETAAFGAALLYFTGSKDHNVALRERAGKRDWKLNEYGLLKGERRLAARTEAAIYHRLGMAWIPPELREDRGEIDAARADRLPRLIELGDIRGDLHCHTSETDGEDTLAAMVDAARERGHDYMAITDHSKNVAVTGGMDAKRLARHAERIRRSDAAREDFTVLAGIEVDILKNGDLDIAPDDLDDLDWVVASVHSHFDLDEKAMTERILRAVETGVVHCLGHPFARQIGRRGPIRFDAEAVFGACAAHGVLIEVNANPARLDLPDTHTRLAKAAGAAFVISTDAHRARDLDLMPWGVDHARRGWLEKRDVINTKAPAAFLEAIGATPRGG